MKFDRLPKDVREAKLREFLQREEAFEPTAIEHLRHILSCVIHETPVDTGMIARAKQAMNILIKLDEQEAEYAPSGAAEPLFVMTLGELRRLIDALDLISKHPSPDVAEKISLTIDAYERDDKRKIQVLEAV